MERETEIRKLTNVLRRVARSAHYAAWNNSVPDAARFCARQFNTVLTRLRELEPQVAYAFAPLSEEASPQVVRIAAHELAAYFGEEREREHRKGAWAYEGGCGEHRHRHDRAWRRERW